MPALKKQSFLKPLRVRAEAFPKPYESKRLICLSHFRTMEDCWSNGTDSELMTFPIEWKIRVTLD